MLSEKQKRQAPASSQTKEEERRPEIDYRCLKPLQKVGASPLPSLLTSLNSTHRHQARAFQGMPSLRGAPPCACSCINHIPGFDWSKVRELQLTSIPRAKGRWVSAPARSTTQRRNPRSRSLQGMQWSFDKTKVCRCCCARRCHGLPSLTHPDEGLHAYEEAD